MLLNRPVLMEEESGGTGTGTGTGTGEGEGDKTPKLSPEVQLLASAVGKLAEGMETLKSNQDKITEALANFGKPQEKEEKPLSLDEKLSELDVDAMSNGDLIKLITEDFQQRLEAKLGEVKGSLEGKVTELGTMFHSKNTQEEIKTIHKDNPDLFEWLPEIKKVLNETPNLSVARALAVVRGENPQKVAEMTKKYAKAPAEARKSYGLTPTSSRTTGTGKMAFKDAANKAFEEVFAGVEGLLSKDVSVR